jgi:hypothetical protein
MNNASFESVVSNGSIAILHGLSLPEQTRVLIIVHEESATRPNVIFSPQLADPGKTVDFQMEVREIPNAGV